MSIPSPDSEIRQYERWDQLPGATSWTTSRGQHLHGEVNEYHKAALQEAGHEIKIFDVGVQGEKPPPHKGAFQAATPYPP